MFPKCNRTILIRCFQILTRQQIIRKYVVAAAESMDAIQYDAKTKKLVLVKKDVPEKVDDHNVLVKVHYAGICGTDVHIIDGDFPCKDTEPLVLGHEFAGVISKVGKKITHVKVGDKVVIDPTRGCNVCDQCRSGKPHYCKRGGLNAYIGMFFDGGWEQYAVVPDTQIHKIPDSLTIEQAALCEPTSCVSHAWDRMVPVPIGSRILIIGSGIIGNLFSSILHMQGHKKVTISEPSEERLKILCRLETGYDLITPECLKYRQREDPNYLFDLMIDCSGNAKAIEHAVTMMDYGGRMCIFGVANPKATMAISPFEMFQKELSIYGAVINPFSYPKALSLLETMGKRYVDYHKLGVKVFSLQEFPDAIEQLRKGSIAKATFKLIH